MNNYKEKLYSDNLHNYDYDEIVNDKQDIDNSPSKKYKNLKDSYTMSPR
ncbi:MAG: hypothetical protein GX053_02765 [Tissierella sp.]|nr:hypothetical protein [Tissierella sp.]